MRRVDKGETDTQGEHRNPKDFLGRMGQPEASSSLNLLGPGKLLPCLGCASGNRLSPDRWTALLGPQREGRAVSEAVLTFEEQSSCRANPQQAAPQSCGHQDPSPSPLPSLYLYSSTREHSCPFKTALWPQAPLEALPAWKPLIKVQRDVKTSSPGTGLAWEAAQRRAG